MVKDEKKRLFDLSKVYSPHLHLFEADFFEKTQAVSYSIVEEGWGPKKVAPSLTQKISYYYCC